MFWKKKNTVEFDGLPVVLSKREAFITDLFGFKKVTKRFLAYKDGNEWRGLVGYEEYKEKTDGLAKVSADVERKLDMILDHLGLQYIPETEKKEPARLVKTHEKFTVTSTSDLTGKDYEWAGSGWLITDHSTPKPKRKYTKRKK